MCTILEFFYTILDSCNCNKNIDDDDDVLFIAPEYPIQLMLTKRREQKTYTGQENGEMNAGELSCELDDI